MEHRVLIHSVTTEDIHMLQHIGRTTFQETFAKSNSEDNMRQYLEEGFSLDKLSEELSHEESEFYFAMFKGEVIGYLKLNTGLAQTEVKDNHALEIERIYVLAAFHGKGVGQQLYTQALQVAQRIHASYIWLGVWEENLKAIHFYTKQGFVAFDKHIFRLGDDEQTDIMMRRNLHVD